MDITNDRRDIDALVDFIEGDKDKEHKKKRKKKRKKAPETVVESVESNGTTAENSVSVTEETTPSSLNNPIARIPPLSDQANCPGTYDDNVPVASSFEPIADEDASDHSGFTVITSKRRSKGEPAKPNDSAASVAQSRGPATTSPSSVRSARNKANRQQGGSQSCKLKIKTGLLELIFFLFIP